MSQSGVCWYWLFSQGVSGTTNVYSTYRIRLSKASTFKKKELSVAQSDCRVRMRNVQIKSIETYTEVQETVRELQRRNRALKGESAL